MFLCRVVQFDIESTRTGGVMANGLSQEQLLKLARLGAAQRLQELKEERQAIEALIGRDGPTSSESSTPRRRRRRRMSAAARNAVGVGMTREWTARRAARKK